MSFDLHQHTGNEDILHLFASVTELPIHDPLRYETTDGLENPRINNGGRALIAKEILDFSKEVYGLDEDIKTAAADLICGLLHLIHANRSDPLDVLHSGLRHFLCEAGEVKLCHS